MTQQCYCVLTVLRCLLLQGDQRKNVSGFLVANKLAKKDLIKIHGF